ncbi:MAG TPA: MlaD family protein, partial [Solirubrobacteraceae bacterium]|nr:MlaD family protein [Solirubrobacteraceae bacterium]
MVARAAAGGALLTAIVVLAVLLLTSGSSYTLRLNFQDAGGLVTGNLVFVGPASVGTVNSITLTPDGNAQVQVSLNSTASPLHVGTVARVFENSLSGNANRYVVLEPGPSQAPEIPSGGLIGLDHTQAYVSLDQLFDTFNP